MVAFSEKTLHLRKRGSTLIQQVVASGAKFRAKSVGDEKGADCIVDPITKMNETLSWEESALGLRDEVAKRH